MNVISLNFLEWMFQKCGDCVDKHFWQMNFVRFICKIVGEIQVNNLYHLLCDDLITMLSCLFGSNMKGNGRESLCTINYIAIHKSRFMYFTNNCINVSGIAC